MIESLNKGDKIIVARLFILADSTRHLVELLDLIEEKGAFLQSLYENIDTSDSREYQFTNIVKCLAEFQSDVISERTKKGMKKAKSRDRKSTRLNSSHVAISYAVFCLKKKKKTKKK